MKPVLVIFFLALLGLNTEAQISIHSNDMPQSGDTIRQSTALDFGSINFLESGAGINWDFSGLIPLAQKVDTFVSVSSTPWLYQLIFFGSANLAQPLTTIDQFPGFEVTDTYNYYNKTNSVYSQVGNATTLNQIPLPNKFSSPDKIFQFPIDYGNSDSSFSNYSFDIPGLGYMGGWKKRVNHVDGWGNLTTPYGTFEVLRVKCDIVQYDSLYLDSLGFGIPTLREYTEYKWLGNGQGLPLCTVTDDGLLPTISYIDSVRSMISGVSEDVARQKVRVFPNPFNEQLSVQLSGSLDFNSGIELLDLNGRVLKSFQVREILSSENVLNFSIAEELPSGIYFIKMSVDGQIILKKIIRR